MRSNPQLAIVRGTLARCSAIVYLATAAMLLCGCRLDMHVQPKYLPYEPTAFFDDGRSERPPVPGTVARGHLHLDELLYTGKENGVESNRFPFPMTHARSRARPPALQHLLHAVSRLHGQRSRNHRAKRVSAAAVIPH